MGRKWGLQFDEEELRRLFRHSQPRGRFWTVVKEEVTRIGRWKKKPRGDAKKGFEKVRGRGE